MARSNDGIYIYIGKLNKNNQFNDPKGTLHFPSGAKLEGVFTNGKLNIDEQKQVIEVPQNALVIDATISDKADEVITTISATNVNGKTILGLKHHQISFKLESITNTHSLLSAKQKWP